MDIEGKVELLELRIQDMEATYKENAMAAREKLNEVHETIGHLDNFVRNGMSSKLTQVATTQKTLWWLITLMFVGVTGIAAAVIRTHILEHVVK